MGHSELYDCVFFTKNFSGVWVSKDQSLGGYHREDGIRTTAAPARVIDGGGINLAQILAFSTGLVGILRVKTLHNVHYAKIITQLV
jgi:hypothetical protein